MRMPIHIAKAKALQAEQNRAIDADRQRQLRELAQGGVTKAEPAPTPKPKAASKAPEPEETE